MVRNAESGGTGVLVALLHHFVLDFEMWEYQL